MGLAAALGLGGLAPGRLLAQRPSGAQLEWRVDATAARTPSVQLGAGANVTAGLYARLAALVAAGAAHRDGVTHLAVRGDATARFHFDPFREGRRGLYGLGGVSLLYDPFESWRPRVHVGIGVEGSARGGRVIAAELTLGGGVRLGAVMRRARALGR
jgi:hypothetical protein